MNRRGLLKAMIAAPMVLTIPQLIANANAAPELTEAMIRLSGEVGIIDVAIDNKFLYEISKASFKDIDGWKKAGGWDRLQAAFNDYWLLHRSPKIMSVTYHDQDHPKAYVTTEFEFFAFYDEPTHAATQA